MRSEITKPGMKAFYWYFNKILRHAIQGLWVDTKSVKMVKDLVALNHRIIILPIYKSFGDFFVQQLVTNSMGMKSGFTFGNFDDTPRVGLIDSWLGQCGYIFSRRKYG